MMIKYGEFTIVYNKEQTIFTNLLMWLNYDEYLQKNGKYIFLFEDEEICEYDDTITDFNFIFCNSFVSPMPLFFNKNIINKENKNNTYFYKKPRQENPQQNCLFVFNQLFSLYSKYDYRLNIKSDYNGIYYCYKTFLIKPEILGIIRIKSNQYMPRFLFAYDCDEFTKEEIVYLIHKIFNPLRFTKK